MTLRDLLKKVPKGCNSIKRNASCSIMSWTLVLFSLEKIISSISLSYFLAVSLREERQSVGNLFEWVHRKHYTANGRLKNFLGSWHSENACKFQMVFVSMMAPTQWLWKSRFVFTFIRDKLICVEQVDFWCWVLPPPVFSPPVFSPRFFPVRSFLRRYFACYVFSPPALSRHFLKQ